MTDLFGAIYGSRFNQRGDTATAFGVLEVGHLTTNNEVFITTSGTASLDNTHIRGSFTLPTNVVIGNTCAKTFQIRLYKDSNKAVLLAIGPITTIGEGLDQATVSEML